MYTFITRPLVFALSIDHLTKISRQDPNVTGVSIVFTQTLKMLKLCSENLDVSGCKTITYDVPQLLTVTKNM